MTMGLGSSRRRPALLRCIAQRRGLVGAVLLGLLLPAVALAREVPRDEPQPLPEPSAPVPPAALTDLPDYGPAPFPEPGEVPTPPARPAAGTPGGGEAAATAAAPAAPALPRSVRAPRLKLFYSRYSDHKIGGLDQPFNIAGVTFYFLSSWIRLGATTRFGLEDSDADRRSYFLDELFSVGLQAREVVRRVTPFVELNTGVGFRMYTTFNNSLPSLHWSFGVDMGTELYFAGPVYLTAAIGWTRPVVSVKRAAPPEESVDLYSDTFVFKVGLGI